MNGDSKIKEVFSEMKNLNAAFTQVVLRDKNDKPIAAAIFVIGKPESTAILAAVEKAEADLA